MKIAVVGLGVAGLSICARLAGAGHAVDGFEQFALMHANGSSHGDTRIVRRTPGEGEAYVRLYGRADPIWPAWEEANGAPLMTWTGGYMIGPPGSAFVHSCALLDERYGGWGRPLNGARMGAATNGALRFPDDWDVFEQADCGVVHADAVRAFLIEHARDRGARLHENVRIAAPIESAALRIDGETRAFDRVIVSAGGWARTLLPEFAPRLSVRRRVIGWFDFNSGGAPANLPVICVDNEVGLYGMSTPDGRYKIGLHTQGDSVDPDRVEEPTAADAAPLSAQIGAHLPLCDPAPVRMARCLYTMTADENFLVAPSRADARVLLFSCCSGHGFKYAPAYGELALDWLEERDNADLRAFGLTGRAAAATGLARRDEA